jgi:hypothetical protein
MFKITGMDEFQRKLRDLSRRAEKLDGTHNINFAELFPDSYVRSKTQFVSMQEMIDAGGIEEQEDIQKPEWSTFVATNSKFDSWEAMLKDAGAEWAKRQLKL